MVCILSVPTPVRVCLAQLNYLQVLGLVAPFNSHAAVVVVVVVVHGLLVRQRAAKHKELLK